MKDGFKLTAKRIKRYLKVSVYLPEDYYKNSDSYSLVISFEGELMFKFLNEDKRAFDLNSLLEENNTKLIVASLHSPDNPDWKESELNPYYMGNNSQIDTSYSFNYFDYITNEFLPLFKQKYRINDSIYLMGFKTGAIAALNMVYSYNIYKGALLFHPNLKECNNQVFSDFDLRFDKDKRMYLFQGEKNTTDSEGNLFYNLQSKLEHHGISFMILDYDLKCDNSYDSIKDHIINALTIVK